jgi:hypothetical protein
VSCAGLTIDLKTGMYRGRQVLKSGCRFDCGRMLRRRCRRRSPPPRSQRPPRPHVVRRIAGHPDCTEQSPPDREQHPARTGTRAPPISTSAADAGARP